MEFQDYYKILGIKKDASKEEIQRAYRKLARKYHPDVNKDKNAEETFKRINEANEVLKDPEKRKLYDSYGENWQYGAQQEAQRHSQGFGGGRNSDGYSRSFHFGSNGGFEETTDFSDFFNSLFGERFSANEQYRNFDMPGRSHESDITVSLSDVYNGATKTISFQTYEAEKNGELRPVTKTLQVKIPKGVTNGAVIRLAGQGEKGQGHGAAGDMLLRIHIAPDSRFTVNGHDLHTAVAISPWEAALGGKIPVQTVSGNVTLTIPKGSQNGKRLRLRGKGIPKRGGSAGDILVELVITIPDTLSSEEKQLLEQISRASTYNPREKHQQRGARHVEI